MLSKSIRYLVKRGRRPAILAVALACAYVGVAFAQTGVPDRITNLTVTASTTTTASLSWRIAPDATDYEVGIWIEGLIDKLPSGSTTATVTVPEPFERVEVSNTQSRTTTDFLGFFSDESDAPTPNEADSQGYGDYYYNTTLSRWRQEFCGHPLDATCASGSVSDWVDMPEGGPTGWRGVFASEYEALLDVTAADQHVIFRDPLGTLALWQVASLTATAQVTSIPGARQYLSVRGVDSADRNGDWAYLVTVGTAATAPTPVAGAPVSLSGLIYTDEVPNIEHYLLDETTLILGWQNIPGARHYDVRLNGEVTRITAQASSGQQLAVSLANLQGQNVGYQVRAVIETGSLDVRVKDADDELIYIVPPNSIVYSRWSADRSVNVDRLGMIKGPAGTERLMTDPEPLSDTITDLISDVLKLSTLMDEDADAGDVQVWTLPLGLLGSIFLGGLTGYGAGRGRLDKAAIIAGGLVFFVCWGYLCPVYLKIPWPVIFSVIVLVVGAAIVIVMNDFFR